MESNYFRSMIVAVAAFLGFFSSVPAAPSSSPVRGPLTPAAYGEILKEFERVYGPLAARAGLNLRIRTLIKSPLVNATAVRAANALNVEVHGGLIRHPLLTAEAFRLIMCHEMGHVLGGPPAWRLPGSEFPSSNSGQPDYYATGICMKLMLNDRDNLSDLKRISRSIDPVMESMCSSHHHEKSEAAKCVRILIAATEVARLLSAITGEKTPFLETPDLSQAEVMKMGHPPVQCRLDTFRAGALCGYSPMGDRPDEAFRLNQTCQATLTRRPGCWFVQNIR